MKKELLLPLAVLIIFVVSVLLLAKSNFQGESGQKNKQFNLSKEGTAVSGNLTSSPTVPSSPFVTIDPGPASPTDRQVLGQAQDTTGTGENAMNNFDQNKTYIAVMKTTEGTITIQFNAKMTPNTVRNFVTLARKKFYNNTIFHRVIKGFMIQGGDPTGTGSGGPGYRFADEPFEGEYTRGTVAMANAGPDTNGSQFFIIHQDNPLPKNYVIFGRVTAGMETVDKIATAAVTQNEAGEPSKPVDPVSITSIEVVEE